MTRLTTTLTALTVAVVMVAVCALPVYVGNAVGRGR